MVATLIFLLSGTRPPPSIPRGDWKLLLLPAAFIPCLYYLLEGHALRYTPQVKPGSSPQSTRFWWA
jgi:drug/metabolite transporter (DMT)-like permease